jgi:hypothetical protein
VVDLGWPRISTRTTNLRVAQQLATRSDLTEAATSRSRPSNATASPKLRHTSSTRIAGASSCLCAVRAHGIAAPAGTIEEFIGGRATFWSELESDHALRRELAGRLVDRLKGKSSAMDEVTTRELPERSLLCRKRHVDGYPGVWALGKEFIGLLKDRPLPAMNGRAAAAFLIYHGEVSEDSDGPVEWCRPVPDGQADDLAAEFPELTLRTEPGHEEAVVPLGTVEVSAA